MTLCLIPSHQGPPSPHPIISSRPPWFIGVSPGIYLLALICPGDSCPNLTGDKPEAAQSQGLIRLTCAFFLLMDVDLTGHLLPKLTGLVNRSY